jgi:ATP-binding cassette subfamily B protein
MSERNDRGSALGAVLRFSWGHWRRRPWLVAGVAGTRLAATMCEVLVPVAAGAMIDGISGGDGAAAWGAFQAMVGLGIGMVLFRFASLSAILPLTAGQMKDVTAEAFGHVQRLSADWHADSFAGSTVRKISRGMWAADSLNDLVLMMLLPGVATLVGTVLVMAFRWPVLALVMALGSAAYLVLAVTLSTRWLAPAARRSNAWDTRVGGQLADSVGANAVVKAFAGERREEALLERVLERWRKRTLSTWSRFVWNDMGMLALLWALRLGVTAGAILLWTRGEASTGDVAYVITAYMVLHGYLRDMGHQIMDLQRAVNEMEELVQLHGVRPAVADAADAQRLAVRSASIRFEDVGFCHKGQVTPLFEGLSLEIPAGQRVGLVGRSGSGKSTLVKLVQRLHDVTEGRLLIGGTDVRSVTQESLRRAIAIVPQEPILFHRSIAENIGYARPGAGMVAIRRAAELANAHGFIERLPAGYGTLVGERGVKLSGGERQRVALARAFLADAPILILDEATSSLDSESESLIQQAMATLLAGRTSIVIAHRLSTVRALDRILVFDHGRLVEDGGHGELLAREDGHYRRLFDHQAGGMVAEGVGDSWP